MTDYQIEWSPQKNEQLIAERGLSFEQVVHVIHAGDIITDEPHPNSDKYPHQRILIVLIDQYVHLVPYVITAENNIFLKTIFPSRIYNQKYNDQ